MSTKVCSVERGKGQEPFSQSHILLWMAHHLNLICLIFFYLFLLLTASKKNHSRESLQPIRGTGRRMLAWLRTWPEQGQVVYRQFLFLCKLTCCGCHTEGDCLRCELIFNHKREHQTISHGISSTNTPWWVSLRFNTHLNYDWEYHFSLG